MEIGILGFSCLVLFVESKIVLQNLDLFVRSLVGRKEMDGALGTSS